MALLVVMTGCREIVYDPAAGHDPPATEADARVDEDAATPRPPPPEPVPEWAEDHAPPPAFPPPPAD